MTLSSSLRILVATTALACTALVAQAQQGDTKAPPQRATAESLAALKTKLNLSADQQAAWTQYENAVKPSDRQWDNKNEGGERPALTEEQKAEINKKREEGRQARESAKNTFRAQLNADQQKTFDAETSRPAPAGGARDGNWSH